MPSAQPSRPYNSKMDHLTTETKYIFQQFKQDRSSLLSREKEERSDHEFRQSLSPTAKQACDIVSCIRLREHETIWSRSNAHVGEDPTLESEELFPGMIFNSAKNHMERTQLWKIVQKMPKGSLLHCHMAATVDLEWLFNVAIETPGMVISASEALVDEDAWDRAVVKIEFSKTVTLDDMNIWHSTYQADSKLPLGTVASMFPAGGKAVFMKWMKDRCSITQTESVQHHLGVDDIWRKLQSAFVTITPIAYYEPITRRLIRKFLRTAYEDGIKWVEVRGMTRSFRLEGQAELTENRLELVRVYKEEIDRFVYGAPEIDLGVYHALEDRLLHLEQTICSEKFPGFSEHFGKLAEFIHCHSGALGNAVDEDAVRVVEGEIFGHLTKLKPEYERYFVVGVEDSPSVKEAKALVQDVFHVLAPTTSSSSGKGRGFWGCRIIWDCLRSFDDAAILEDMKLCLQAKKLYPDTISGYDLVGPEDAGRTLHSLAPLLLWFRSQCELQNLTIPFFLHAGETTGSGNSTDQNLYDALLLSSRRLGHAFSLYKHPLLIDMVKERQVLVECCPISNEVLRYTASITSHPLPALLSRGVKASLSNDDPGMMGQNSGGLSHDFWQALQGWDDLGLAGLASLAQNSVRWSAFEDQSNDEWHADITSPGGLRAQRIEAWDAEWEDFCQWVVDEFC
ncbi:uncharacterized protein L3040_008521 [Drepanopeziza brunnea f. sp. 'multigermtubi']|uniref:uncharacterized protein n=1 Tax=Drepanopeziza brunnea f. sp. 'multigermtubi' TaxID=698441 RepID=UPI0023A1D7AC|nr:hypothetical protein L3040_008521 [Drepanopeziza brunnea f. sp. 'multigermtubi']